MSSDDIVYFNQSILINQQLRRMTNDKTAQMSRANKMGKETLHSLIANQQKMIIIIMIIDKVIVILIMIIKEVIKVVI